MADSVRPLRLIAPALVLIGSLGVSGCGLLLGSNGAAEKAAHEFAPKDQTPVAPNPLNGGGLAVGGVDRTTTTTLDDPLPPLTTTTWSIPPMVRTTTTLPPDPQVFSPRCLAAAKVSTAAEKLWFMPPTAAAEEARNLWLTLNAALGEFAQAVETKDRAAAVALAAFVNGAASDLGTVAAVQQHAAVLAQDHRSEIAVIGPVITRCEQLHNTLPAAAAFDPDRLPDGKEVENHFHAPPP